MELIHPNILHLVEHFEDHSRIVMVTELCDGGDLDKFMKSQPGRKLSAVMTDRFFYQIVCGLEYLHRNGYVHRDLKLANILLSCRSVDAVVKIGDFGFAKATMALMMTKTLCGTPLYQVSSHCNNLSII
jgi:serine/threonine protein kinase